jgi:hypothetical protein
MSNEQMQNIQQQRDARIGAVVRQIVEAEWRQVLRELDALDVDSGNVAQAAQLVGQYRVLNRIMAALSEGSLGSDYEIESQWRCKLVERVVEAFDLDAAPPTPPVRYRGLAYQIAEATGLEVIEE